MSGGRVEQPSSPHCANTMNTSAVQPGAQPAPNRLTAALVGAGLVILVLTAALAWQVGRHSAQPETVPPTVAAAAPPAPTVPASAAEVVAPPPAPEPAQVAAQAAPAPVRKSTPVRVAAPVRTAAATPAPAAQHTDAQGNTTFDGGAATPAARPIPAAVPAWSCASCGVVDSVTEIKRDGDANGVGAVAGGVLGGLIGSQVGGGNGKRAATVIGAIGGGIAGHQVEKKMHAQTSYDVRVRMDDGSYRTINQSQPASVGSRVNVEGGVLRPAPAQDGVRG